MESAISFTLFQLQTSCTRYTADYKHCCKLVVGMGKLAAWHIHQLVWCAAGSAPDKVDGTCALLAIHVGLRQKWMIPLCTYIKLRQLLLVLVWAQYLFTKEDTSATLALRFSQKLHNPCFAC